MQIFSKKIQAWVVWVLVIIFTMIQLFIEIITNAMVDDLMQSFHVGAAEIGLLSSSFFYTFLLMQIPVGYLLDRFNIQFILPIACVGFGIGCFLFSNSYHVQTAILSRLLIGGCAAFGFLGMMKITRLWFPHSMFSFMVGLSQFLVMLGSSLGEHLTASLITQWGWRSIMMGFGILTWVVALLLNRVLSYQSPYNLTSISSTHNMSVMMLIKNKQFWLAGLFGCGVFSVFTAFNALWGLSFIKVVYHFQYTQAAAAISIVLLGMAMGCPIVAILSYKMQKNIILMRVGSFLTLLTLSLLIYFPVNFNNTMVFILFFAIGFFSSVFFLCFSIVKNQWLAITLCNIFVMSSALFLQPLIGFLLSHKHTGMMLTSEYSIAEYQFAMTTLIAMLSMAFLASLFLKEKG